MNAKRKKETKSENFTDQSGGNGGNIAIPQRAF